MTETHETVAVGVGVGVALEVEMGGIIATVLLLPMLVKLGLETVNTQHQLKALRPFTEIITQ